MLGKVVAIVAVAKKPRYFRSSGSLLVGSQRIAIHQVGDPVSQGCILPPPLHEFILLPARGQAHEESCYVLYCNFRGPRRLHLWDDHNRILVGIRISPSPRSIVGGSLCSSGCMSPSPSDDIDAESSPSRMTMRSALRGRLGCSMPG